MGGWQRAQPVSLPGQAGGWLGIPARQIKLLQGLSPGSAAQGAGAAGGSHSGRLGVLFTASGAQQVHELRRAGTELFTNICGAPAV